MRTILHVDMDAFFASVEELDHPEWRGKPLVVGSGPHERGVVSTANYAARKFGIHSAMPSRTAFQLCPQAIFVPPRMSRYAEISQKAFTVFSHYSPFVEPVSIDEAFLDISGTLHLFGPSSDEGTKRRLGEALRDEIRERCGVTCSVGIAANRLLAKIGSEVRKPDGLTLMPTESDAIARFLAPKPLGVIWGVGAKTAEELKAYGLTTCGDIQRLVQRNHGNPGGFLSEDLIESAFGRGDDQVYWETTEEKSVSREYTFPTDESDRKRVRAQLLDLVQEVGARFRTARRWARTARLKLRDADFSTITRQLSFAEPARDDITFRKAALELFEREWYPGRTIRLIGFGVTAIQSEPGLIQDDLFGQGDSSRRKSRERLSETLDRLRSRGYEV